jgi:hypothetical protein
MYPVVRRASNNFSLTAVKNSSDQNCSVSINKIYDDLIEQKNKSIAKPGKGFYIIINHPNSNSFVQKLKSTLSPFQERINKTYNLNPQKETGLLVDMIV